MILRPAAAALALLFLLPPAAAQPANAARTAITAALTDWTRDFNAGAAGKVCRLFAPDLRYDFGKAPEGGFDQLCRRLRRALADRGKRYSYSFRIKEILVSGDLAVVRLVWTVRMVARGSGRTAVWRERGMDVFRRQQDGSWKIIRYIGYKE